MCFSAKTKYLFAFVLVLASLWVSPVVAEDTFPARVTLALCGEYQLGDVEVGIYYTVGEDPAEYQAEITAQTIDDAMTSGTFDILLPSIYGTADINVFARCTNTFGPSAASNEVSITNCDALALRDDDADGIPNNLEDTDCGNFFSPGDASNPDNFDTDGDGLYDIVEIFAGTDPTNPGSSPRPRIFAGGSFDPDDDGDSNAVVWRIWNGTWYIRDFETEGNHLAVQFGLPGDTPFVYDTLSDPTNVGIIRQSGTELHWYFRDPGFLNADSTRSTVIPFGVFGDNIIPGPWETPGVTNPAVARLFAGVWTFAIYMSDGTVRNLIWGVNGDIPKPGDFDGDGIYDLAVYRPSEQKTYVLNSSDSGVNIYDFGTATADYTPRGDYTGDGLEDITFWEPLTGLFSTVTSDSSYDVSSPVEMQLGLYNVHVPLNYFRRGGKDLYTVIDHATGYRYYREDNNEDNAPIQIQWGLAGDAQG